MSPFEAIAGAVIAGAAMARFAEFRRTGRLRAVTFPSFGASLDSPAWQFLIIAIGNAGFLIFGIILILHAIWPDIFFP